MRVEETRRSDPRGISLPTLSLAPGRAEGRVEIAMVDTGRDGEIRHVSCIGDDQALLEESNASRMTLPELLNGDHATNPGAGLRVPGEGARMAQSDDQPGHITGDDFEDTSSLAKPASGRGDG
jgi:hypothetical protein